MTDEDAAEPASVPVDGATRLYAIIGHPIAQVRAPRVFNRMFRRLGAAAAMIPVDIAPQDLETGVAGLKAMANLDGIIVTVPHKVRMLDHSDTVGPMARQVGAVNALRRQPDGRWHADMFDGRGFVAGLAAQGHDVTGKSALLVGAGGAGGAIAFALAEAGIAALRVHDIDRARARMLAAQLRDARPDLDITDGAPDIGDHDLAINATPMGMAVDDPLPLKVAALRPGMLVADVIMKPAETRLLERDRAQPRNR